jgi:ATP-binding cassette, subfamily B, bacterial PglK
LVDANKKRFTVAGEAFGGIKNIKLSGLEAVYLERFNLPSIQYSRSHAGHNTLGIIPGYVVEVVLFGAILTLTFGLVMTSGGIQSTVMGEIMPLVGLYALSVIRLKPLMQAIYQGVAGLKFGGALVANLHKELNPDKLVSIHKAPSETKRLRQHIFLENITFHYPGANKSSLDNITLEIPRLSSLGLVGTTGAGKTTLVDVILGLLQPSQGGLFVDGERVTLANLRSWQRNLGYVPQDIFLSDATIAENIALGIPKSEIDYEQVTRCARSAQLDNFIMQEFPDRYETVVGERGLRLSGGQRQRIGIARALYHNPDVLIFDEATSALDSVTERAVMDAIDMLAHQKTIILIAHRMSTVRHCDQIVLLDKGRIKAVGSFDELKNTDAHFRELSGA